MEGGVSLSSRGDSLCNLLIHQCFPPLQVFMVAPGWGTTEPEIQAPSA